MSDCKPIADECIPAPRSGESWTMCLPWGGRIYSDGSNVYAQPGSPPPDGVYGKIVIANGCIVGVEKEDVPLYTGSPCAPLPNGCNEDSGGVGSGGCCPPSSQAGNQYTLDVTGKPYVRCFVQAGDNITVTGNGTSANPYIISSKTGIGTSTVYIKSGNSAIQVSGAGTRDDPIVITHKETGTAGTHNGLTVDNFGHITGTGDGGTGSGTASGLQGIVPGQGIDVTTDQRAGIATVSLQKVPKGDAIQGSYAFGDYTVTVDSTGRVQDIVYSPPPPEPEPEPEPEPDPIVIDTTAQWFCKTSNPKRYQYFHYTLKLSEPTNVVVEFITPYQMKSSDDLTGGTIAGEPPILTISGTDYSMWVTSDFHVAFSDILSLGAGTHEIAITLVWEQYLLRGETIVCRIHKVTPLPTY